MRMKNGGLILATGSEDETMALGERLGSVLRAGDVVALFGDLGAGKTVLAKGIAAGLGVDADVHSPTFTLIHEHFGEIPLYHVDLYRLSDENEVQMLGIDEYIYGNGVTVIEWADRMPNLLPPERIDITLTMQGDDRRKIAMRTESTRLCKAIEELQCSP